MAEYNTKLYLLSNCFFFFYNRILYYTILSFLQLGLLTLVWIKTVHSCPIILNNRYNGVPPAPGTGMAQSLITTMFVQKLPALTGSANKNLVMGVIIMISMNILKLPANQYSLYILRNLLSWVFADDIRRYVTKQLYIKLTPCTWIFYYKQPH